MKPFPFTPGPWTIEERADKGLSIKSGSLCLIAKVGPQAYLYKANANLISAAPDLLEAAERFHAWFKEFDSAAYSEINCPELAALLDAIKKARGEK